MPTAPCGGAPVSARLRPLPRAWFDLVRAHRPSSPAPQDAPPPRPAHSASVDIAKGLGILMVVYVHATSDLYPMKFFLLFAMPLFFFISGYLHKVEPRLSSFARKKATRLLVPYLSFLLLLSSFRFFHVWHHHELTKAWIERGLFDLVWGGPRLTGIFPVAWFLTCLFLTQLSMNWLLVRFRLSTVVSVVAAALLLSYANSVYLPTYSLPLDANVVASAAPFFLAGFLYRTYGLNRRAITAFGLLGCAVSLLLLARGLPVFYDMRAGFYGTPFVTPVLALCCIFACWQLSALLSRIPLFSPLLQSFGAMSLGIMLLHKAVPLLPGYGFIPGRSELTAFLASLLSAWMLSLLFNRFSLARALFLGSEKDFRALFQPSPVLRETTETAQA